jgi:hypothetical protein
MKKIIYGLLITTSIGSAVYATQAPQRPTKSSPTSLPDKSVCPDVLKMSQLNELKAGKLKFGSHPFKLHTSQTEFDAMLPGKAQLISKAKSEAHILEGVLGRSVISTPAGHIVKCTYTFRTALASKAGGEHKTFAITSEPSADHKPLPKELVSALSRNASN